MVDHINNGEEGYSVREKLNTVIDRTNTLNGIENQVEANKNLSQQNKARIDKEIQDRIDADQNLQDQIDNKSNAGHKHPISDINGLQDELDGKQPVGDYVTEAPADGYQYGRQLQGGVMTWTVNEGGAGGGGAGAGMIISAEPPAAEDREPGLQWMNENTGEIWIWDGVRWLEFPASGQIGPQGEKGEKGDKGDKGDPGDGADVDLSAYSTTAEADAKYQPKGDYLTDFTELDPTVPQHVKGITTTNISHWDQAWDEATEANGWGNHADAGYLKAGDDITAGNATFSGTVDAVSFTVNGEPIGGGSDVRFNALNSMSIGQNAYDVEASNSNYDVAVGNRAMELFQPTGSTMGRNTAVGYQALQNMTDGYDNVAIGSGALSAATEQVTQNIAIGRGALKKQKRGGSNIGIGKEAMGNASVYYADTLYATSNIAIGNSALYQISDRHNIGIGQNSGNNAYYYQYSLFLGVQTAGHLDMTETRTTNAIALGYQASVNQSNTMSIGNSQLATINTNASINSSFLNAEKGVMSRGSAVPTMRDIIDVLRTLKDATRDEETVEGIRTAISGAADGLIERFEALDLDTTKQHASDYEAYKQRQLDYERSIEGLDDE